MRRFGSRSEWFLPLRRVGCAVAFLLGCSSSAPSTSVRAPDVGRQAPSQRTEQLGDVLLRDDFDNPAVPRLPLRSGDPSVEQGYVGGEYLIRMSPAVPGSYLVGPTELFSNVHISVDARLVGGTEARFIGVACRVERTGTRATGYYVFAIFPATGRFILHRAGGGVTELVPSQSLAAIRRGTASNHLELKCARSTIAAMINGTEVASVQDTRFDSGLVSVIVGRSGSIPVEGRFDNLVVREAPGEP